MAVDRSVRGLPPDSNRAQRCHEAAARVGLARFPSQPRPGTARFDQTRDARESMQAPTPGWRQSCLRAAVRNQEVQRGPACAGRHSLESQSGISSSNEIFYFRASLMFSISYKELLEARVGIEPTNKGFADLCLTTWLPRR